MSITFRDPKYRLEGAVFAGLTEDPQAVALRTAKLVALLVGHLRDSSHINEKEIGALMIEVLR
jgi:hypothetical protein